MGMNGGHQVEIHYGIVTDNVDEEQRGWLKVQCGTLAPTEGELPDWIEPLFPFLSSSDNEISDGGWLFIPDIGVVVELRMTVSSPNDERAGFSAIVAPNIRWSACSAARGSDVVPELFKTNYPDRRGITTGRGHVLLFDDTKGDEKLELSITHGGGTNFLSMDPDGVYLASAGDSTNLIQLDSTNKTITILDGSENVLVFNESGWFIGTADSDVIAGGGGEMSIMTGTLLINGTGVRAEVGEFKVEQTSLMATAVIVEGTLGFQSTIASSLAEIAGLIAGLGLVAATTTGVVVPALQAGLFSSTLLFAE